MSEGAGIECERRMKGEMRGGERAEESEAVEADSDGICESIGRQFNGSSELTEPF